MRRFIRIYIVAAIFIWFQPTHADDCSQLIFSTQNAKKVAFQIQQAAILENSKCVDLKNGESRIINQPLGDPTLTTVPAQFNLKRTGNKSYRSVIAIHFYSHDLEIAPKELHDFKIKVQNCLASANRLLKSSDGTSLEIRLSEHPEKTHDGAVSVIAVDRNVPREDAKHYGISSSCPTIVHEILHLHGLVDEYTEATTKLAIDPVTGDAKFTNDAEAQGNLAFNCRHAGASSSVMSNQEMAFKEAELKRFDVWEYHSCIQGSADVEDGCITGYHLARMGTFLLKEGLVPNEEEYKAKGLRNLKKIGKKERRSLLGDGQFNAIIHPGCKLNALYYACAANAYVTSFAMPENVKSAGSTENRECQPTPVECENPDSWTGLN